MKERFKRLQWRLLNAFVFRASKNYAKGCQLTKSVCARVYVCRHTGFGSGSCSNYDIFFNVRFCFNVTTPDHTWMAVCQTCTSLVRHSLTGAHLVSFISFSIWLNYEPFSEQVYCVLWLVIFLFFHHLSANIVVSWMRQHRQPFDGCVLWVQRVFFCAFPIAPHWVWRELSAR